MDASAILFRYNEVGLSSDSLALLTIGFEVVEADELLTLAICCCLLDVGQLGRDDLSSVEPSQGDEQPFGFCGHPLGLIDQDGPT